MAMPNTLDRLGVTQFTKPTDREIHMVRAFEAPRRLVFDAWTRPEHLQRWLLGPSGWTMPVCEVDLRVGGSWHFVWRNADGTEMGMAFVIVGSRAAAPGPEIEYHAPPCCGDSACTAS